MPDRELLQKLSDILFLAKVHYRLWEELMKRRDQHSVDLVNNGYSTFFEYTRNAHFKATFIELHKLIETRRDTVNIKSIFDMVPANHEIKRKISSYEKKYSHIRKDIFVIRNEVEAHASATYSPDESFNKVSISAQDIETFIAGTGKILNEIASTYFKQQSALNEIEESLSVQRLFDAIEMFEKA